MKAKPQAATRSHQVRIIGGQWKRSILPVIDAEGLRPTPDRVRETVFNWISHLNHAHWANLRCLDLFAGSGALGFEAASRGVASVLMLENHTPAFKQLELNRQKLRAEQVKIVRADALTYAQNLVRNQEKFDVIFLDPPFAQGFLEKVLPLCAELLSESGLLYVEAEHSLCQDDEDDLLIADLPFLQNWQLIRADKAGQVHFHILQRSNFAAELPENQA